MREWEKLQAADFEKPFTFDKHADLPPDQRPAYRLADTEMTFNVLEDRRLVGSVTLRAIVLHDPQGQTPAERWPVALVPPDRERAARALLNE